MNLLAHLYLSNGINEVMFGNFIGDFIKGKDYLHYPEEVQKGILLHRKIDDFTDKHPLHKQSRDRFRKGYRLFSGVIVDILYDHYLANHWGEYTKEPLEEFAAKAYQYIELNKILLPDKLKAITPHIIKSNWLLLYKSLPGLERVYKGMAIHTSLPNEYKFAMNIIEQEYNKLENEFIIFFNELRSYLDI